jgi:hypothetical protein
MVYGKYRVSMVDLSEYVVLAQSEIEARDMMEYTAGRSGTEIYSVEKLLPSKPTGAYLADGEPIFDDDGECIREVFPEDE